MIILHALAGLVAFVAGYLLVSAGSPVKKRWLLWVYLIAMTSLTIFLFGALVSHWTQIGVTQQIVFGGLTLLGFYVVWCAYQAWRLLNKRPAGWHNQFIDAVGFTLIALFDGFVIVGLIDVSVPTVIVVALGIGAIIVGRVGLERIKKRHQ